MQLRVYFYRRVRCLILATYFFLELATRLEYKAVEILPTRLEYYKRVLILTRFEY